MDIPHSIHPLASLCVSAFYCYECCQCKHLLPDPCGGLFSSPSMSAELLREHPRLTVWRAELRVVFQSTILRFCWKWSRVSVSPSPCQPWLLAALLTLEGMKLQLTVHFICIFLIMNDIELYFMSQLWIRTLLLPLKKYYVKITKYILLGERKKSENGNLLNNSHYRNLKKTEKVLWRLWLEGLGGRSKAFQMKPGGFLGSANHSVWYSSGCVSPDHHQSHGMDSSKSGI